MECEEHPLPSAYGFHFTLNLSRYNNGYYIQKSQIASLPGLSEPRRI